MNKPSRTIWKVKGQVGSYSDRAGALIFACSLGLQEDSVYSKEVDWVTSEDDNELTANIFDELRKDHKNARRQ
jgi:hypothetical protein